MCISLGIFRYLSGRQIMLLACNSQKSVFIESGGKRMVWKPKIRWMDSTSNDPAPELEELNKE